MKYKNIVLIIILLILLNFALMNFINQFQSNFSLNFSNENIQVHTKVDKNTGQNGIILQIVNSDNGYYLVTSNPNYTIIEFEYYLEYYTLENQYQWSVKIPINYTTPSILAISEDYVILDFPPEFRSIWIDKFDFKNPFKVYNLRERIFTDLIIKELKPFTEFVNEYNKTEIRYSHDSQYSGIIKNNQLILVESTKFFPPSLYELPKYNDVRIITYDLSLDKLIDIFFIKENEGNKLISSEIQGSVGTKLNIVIKTYLSLTPLTMTLTMEVESIEIDYESGNIVQHFSPEEVTCEIRCYVFVASNNNVTIIEKDRTIIEKNSILRIGNKDNHSIYIWDPLYKNIYLVGSVVIHKELILIYGYAGKVEQVFEAFIGFLSIKYNRYNLSLVDIHKSSWNSSAVTSVSLNSQNQLLLAISTREQQNDTLIFSSYVYIINPIQDAMIDFLEDYPYLPYVISSSIIITISTIINWYNKRKKSRIITSEMYPESN